jgi:hypothetical protein
MVSMDSFWSGIDVLVIHFYFELDHHLVFCISPFPLAKVKFIGDKIVWWLKVEEIEKEGGGGGLQCRMLGMCLEMAA